MDRDSSLEILRTAKPFSHLDQKARESLLCYGKFINFRPNQHIIEQGKQAQGLNIIVKGTATVVVKVLVEGNLEVANLKPGDFFGEVNLLEQTPCTASVIANADTTCFILSKISFDLFNVYFPHIYFEIVRALIEDVIDREANLILKIKKLIKNSPTTRKYLKKNHTVQQKKNVQPPKESILQKYTYLKKLTAFNALDKNEFDQFIHDSKLIQVSTNVKLIQPKMEKISFFFILQGAVKLTIDNINIGVLGPNTLFGPSALTNKKQEICYTTCSNSLLIEITDEQIKKMKKNNKTLWYRFYGQLCLYIVSLQRKLLTEVVRLSSEKRDVFTI